jgi:hypothetical protein
MRSSRCAPRRTCLIDPSEADAGIWAAVCALTTTRRNRLARPQPIDDAAGPCPASARGDDACQRIDPVREDEVAGVQEEEQISTRRHHARVSRRSRASPGRRVHVAQRQAVAERLGIATVPGGAIVGDYHLAGARRSIEP